MQSVPAPIQSRPEKYVENFSLVLRKLTEPTELRESRQNPSNPLPNELCVHVTPASFDRFFNRTVQPLAQPPPERFKPATRAAPNPRLFVPRRPPRFPRFRGIYLPSTPHPNTSRGISGLVPTDLYIAELLTPVPPFFCGPRSTLERRASGPE